MESKNAEIKKSEPTEEIVEPIDPIIMLTTPVVKYKYNMMNFITECINKKQAGNPDHINPDTMGVNPYFPRV